MKKIVEKSKIYSSIINDLVLKFHGSKGIFQWLLKYPIYHSGRNHLFDIYNDIVQCHKGSKILDQGAAEGIFCKLLSDAGFDTFAVDIEPEFLEFWKILGVDGVIGDCFSLDWWNQCKYDIIIACVWVTSSGEKINKKNEFEKRKKAIQVVNCWGDLLNKNGCVYVDVNKNKVPFDMFFEVVGKYFFINEIKSHRDIFKLVKK